MLTDTHRAEGKTYGYTTGTYAVAAAKAAATVLLGGDTPERITVSLPNDMQATVPVISIEKNDDYVTALVIKESVEDTDVTDSMKITAQVAFSPSYKGSKIKIDGAVGIGRITKEGLQLHIGEAAINPAPRRMIRDNIRELTERSIDVIISAPDGERIAKDTYNARLGILGGISIIGTTGIMQAKSSESFKDTILTQLNYLKENRSKEIIITPGNISEEAMLLTFKDRLSKETMVQSGDFLGFTLKEAVKKKVPFVLAGHPGKLAKVLENNFQTHYSKARPANTAVIELFKDHLDYKIIESMAESPTIEGIVAILIKEDKRELIDMLADKIEACVKEYLKLDTPIPTLLFNMEKELIGSSKAGKSWVTK